MYMYRSGEHCASIACSELSIFDPTQVLPIGWGWSERGASMVRNNVPCHMPQLNSASSTYQGTYQPDFGQSIYLIVGSAPSTHGLKSRGPRRTVHPAYGRLPCLTSTCLTNPLRGFAEVRRETGKVALKRWMVAFVVGGRKRALVAVPAKHAQRRECRCRHAPVGN